MSGELLRQLVELMPPHEGAGDEVDWDQAERELGMAYPGDYRRFVDVFGAGEFVAAFPSRFRVREGRGWRR
ncbi:hypothetical protein ACWEFL_20685 [Streptomyces sp. NPDC004838]